MPSLLIKNAPPQLHARLKRQVLVNERSLNSGTIYILKPAVAATA